MGKIANVSCTITLDNTGTSIYFFLLDDFRLFSSKENSNDGYFALEINKKKPHSNNQEVTFWAAFGANINKIIEGISSSGS